MRLHDQVVYKDIIISIYEAQLNELRAYLNSDKFTNDKNVNRDDIIMRLNELDNDIWRYIDERFKYW